MSPTAPPPRTGAGEIPSAPTVPAARRVVQDPAVLRRVLVVKLSALGDIAHALPLARALRAALPDAFIGWAIKERFGDLLEGNPHLDAVYPLPGSGVRALRELGATLRAEQFDAALDAQGLLVSGIVTRLSGAPLRIGLDRNREGNALWLTHPVVPARGRVHMADAVMGFCDALGIPRTPPQPQTYLAASAAAEADALLAECEVGPRVGCIVGASTPEKAWPEAHWVELAHRLAQAGIQPVLLGGPGEVPAAATIAWKAHRAVVLNLTGKTPLRTLASVLARCDVVVGGDSGPTHLAVAVGTPVVGLYGVTDPARTGPQWGAAPTIVLDNNDAVPPAFRRARHVHVADALARITPREACEAVGKLLRSDPPAEAREGQPQSHELAPKAARG